MTFPEGSGYKQPVWMQGRIGNPWCNKKSSYFNRSAGMEIPKRFFGEGNI